MKKQPAVPYPDAPSHLSERAAALWRDLGRVHARTAGRQVMFRAALEAMDRADQAREVIAREGMTKTTPATGAVHLHPLLRVERESRQQFTKLWSELGLDSVF